MSVFEALTFELNKLTNFSLYKPSSEELGLYSGYIVDNTHPGHPNKNQHLIRKYGEPQSTGVPRNIKGKNVPGITKHYNDLLKQFLLVGEVHDNTIKKSVDNGMYDLLGLSFLPWGMPLKDKNGKYIVKKAKGRIYPRNPLNSQNLMSILKIILIITVISFVGYEGYKRYM